MIANQANTIVNMCKTNTELRNTTSEQDKEIDNLYKRVANLDSRLENQEQYSRRTSLRFHNIKIPVDESGNIIHPVNTDDIIVKLCNEKLDVSISKDDIGRSHVIGKVKNGRSQVIVRFISYRKREMVYSAKRKLKGDPHKIFITENLTNYRTNIVKALAELKFTGHIYTYWTSDGRIYVKQFNNSRKVVIHSHDDIREMLRITADEDVDRTIDDAEVHEAP